MEYYSTIVLAHFCLPLLHSDRLTQCHSRMSFHQRRQRQIASIHTSSPSSWPCPMMCSTAYRQCSNAQRRIVRLRSQLLCKEVWPARFGTRNTEPGSGTRHIWKMTWASCRWSRACVRVGSWRRNAYSPPLGIFLQRRRDSTTTQQHDDSGVTEGERLRGDTLRIGCSSGFWGDSATAGEIHDLFYVLCLQCLISRHWQEIVTFAINLEDFFHWNFEVWHNSDLL